MTNRKSSPSPDLRRKVLSGSLWAFGGKVSGVITALVINALLARLLSPADLGSYFLLFSVVSAAALAAQCGLPSTVVRLLGETAGRQEPHMIRPVVAAASRYAAISAGVVVFLCLLAASAGSYAGFSLPSGIVPLFPLAVAWLVALAWQDVVSAIFRGLQDIRHSVVFGGAAGAVLLALLLIAVRVARGHASLRDVVVCSLASAAISVVTGVALVWLKTAGLPAGSAVRLKGLFRASFPMLVAVIAGAVMTRTDLWMLGLYRSAHEVALYGAASRLAATIPFFLMITNTAISPVIAELAAQGRRRELETLLQKAALMAFLPCLLPLISFLAFGGGLLGIVFGSYYRAGAAVLAILAVGYGFSVWTGACGLTLIMTGNQSTQMAITVFCSLFTVAGSFWAVRSFGATGVALASSTGLILQNVLMLQFARRTAGIWTHAGFALPDLRLLYRGGE